MNVPKGIKSIFVKIASSDAVFESLAGGMGLVEGDGMDLCSDGAKDLGNLFALPKENDTTYDFSMSSELFQMLASFSGKHDFTLKIIDQEGNEKTAVLTINI